MIPSSLEVLNKNAGAVRVASVNVNGIRAAYRRNMPDWIEARDVDILCLQEVRAPDKIVRELVGEGWHILHAEAKDKGRAGVAILSKAEPIAVRPHIGDEYFADSGRWVEADFTMADGSTLCVVSCYVHSGELGTAKQEDKYRFLQRMTDHLPVLKEQKDHVLVVGDLNVVHTEKDIKNWKPNHNKRAGVMDEEIAYFDGFFGELGYKDVARELAGDEQGPYTWWSWRGQAFVNNAGWRIDYHMATPALSAKAIKSHVDRASEYALRFSDHAPLVVDYQF
ncbi:exodeoxyribonuclease III [Glutamicibacter sp. MNS18]|uniref:exodeoxyribonuclease III n=1 Tax=Glutamicibacter sp. MNS18 TaxID=2989817 RepID=UPI0022354CA2|nr:exodeoxyribonuclease III [Glutamicibacter sp. MNS18]MCW4465040.1 exodeoxyribonuclease III [Glutamicibacter sp. MNS18]